MCIYSVIPVLRSEIDDLQHLIDEWTAMQQRAEDRQTAAKLQRCIDRMEQFKKKLIQENNRLAADLEAIKAEDEEIYNLIYCHDIKGLSWTAAFHKACPDLMSINPYDYARSRVRRFLAKWEKMPKVN